MTKEKKTESDLIALIMSEVRKHPECSHISSVGIIRPVNMSWDAVFVCNGPKISGPKASEVVHKIRAQYDVAT